MNDLTRLFSNVRAARESIPRNGRRLWAHQRCRIFVDTIGRYMEYDKPSCSTILMDLADSIILDVDQRRTKQVSGDYILNDIITTMNTYESNGEPFILRLDQQMMIAHILTSCLPMIYGHDLENQRERLLKRLKTKKIYETMLIMASRRVGKTTCIACVAAAIMICKPTFKMTIFAHIKDAAGRVMAEVVKFILMNDRGRKMYQQALSKNVGNLTLTDLEQPTLQKRIEIYSSKADVCLSFSLSLSLFLLFFFFSFE